MPSVFSKNAIISGDIDYYCLVCDDILRNEAKVTAHIQKAVHKKNLDHSCYITNYENEGIRKVNKGYYCEFCNILLTTSLKISFHIKQKDHECKKVNGTDKTSLTKYVQRHEKGDRAFNDILVTENAWHGLIDNSCAICNVDIDNKELHRTDRNHALKLIQTQLLIGEWKSIYRKLDNHTIHCITCNEVLSLPADNHFKQRSHLEHYVQCHLNKKAIYNETSQVKTHTGKPKLDVVAEVKNCAKKPVHGNVKSTGNPSLGKVSNEDSDTQKIDPLDVFAKQLNLEDYIYKNENGSYMCVLCEWNLSDSFGSLKAHIQGHQMILQLHKENLEENKKVKTHLDNTNINDAFESEQKEISNPPNVTSKGIFKSENSFRSNNENDNMNTNSIIDEKEEILNVVTDLQKQGIDIDFIYEKVLCKKCNTFLSFQLKIIKDHIDEHKNYEIDGSRWYFYKPNKNVTSDKALTSDCNNNTNRSDVDSDTFNKCNAKQNMTSNISNWAKDDNQGDGTKMYTRPMLMAKIEDGEKASSSSATKIDNASGETNTSKATASNADNAKNKTKKQIIKFASKNYINYDYSPHHAYCRVCRTQVPNSFSSLEQHVKGAKHTTNVATKVTSLTCGVSTCRKSANSSKLYKTSRLEIFEESVYTVETRIGIILIINEKFRIDFESYHFLTATVGHLRCHLCEINIDRNNMNPHVQSSDHMTRLKNTPTIVSEISEFLRIPREDIFHCGFCNLILPTWDNVQNHLKSGTHKDKKIEAELSLQRILPQLRRDEMREEFMAMMFMRMLFGSLLRH